ncbi:uncharacterized protein MELLADRAFT_105893 [Melampsora larici-populina 98AG31]|uniref:F-box domain-containing protein n=1 Tax=Melampsora larici-populina (strain 98AG31 / pathotype 3-4-7) TaxID=747676 RepID=F4RJP0_MELLP|nr:uncharacterized protein MELLADRAFT_105893 [Melampsora larici-populina 98AG31]EGG07342.1 hypothetical protein MELLADRAFT_105893 [Melampsora larici-populina 98AG31]
MGGYNLGRVKEILLKQVAANNWNLTLRKLCGLSAENLLNVLSQCTGLTTLQLHCPSYPYGHGSTGVRNLGCNLNKLFSELGQLQHLKIRGAPDTETAIECFIEPIRHLPLLESLELAFIRHSDLARPKFSVILSNLMNLKKLVFYKVTLKEWEWGRQGPLHLVDLSIINCDMFSLSDAPTLISNWAPHLTHLELRIRECDEYQDNLADFDPNQIQFCLPALRHLKLWPLSECCYIPCFINCKNLQHLTYFHHWPYHGDLLDTLLEFSDFITTNVFHKLKAIVVSTVKVTGPTAMASTLSPLASFCKSQGIEFNIDQDYVDAEYTMVFES